MKLSVCIPTHERHTLLGQRCLPSLLKQTRLPDEVVVADSSRSAHVSEFYQQWAERFKPLTFTYVRTEERSGVRNRWEAFCRSSGDIVLFADDDIAFSPEALAELLATFQAHPDAMGVGMRYHHEGRPPKNSLSRRFRDWYLSKDKLDPNSITPGGRSSLGISRIDAKPIPVQWLPGGAMAFRREALLAVGPLPGLNELFRLRISTSADTVLSDQVALRGPLLLLTRPFAWHPEKRTATSTIISLGGWRKGLVDTVGLAHILRWLARDQRAALHEWLLLAILNGARTMKTVLQSPFAAAAWLRLAGFLYGSIVAFFIWRRIPKTPDQAIAVSPKWLFL